MWSKAGRIASGVDVTEEAKQVALYRYEVTGERYDDDEIRSFYQDDIVNLDAQDREEITFESWLQEYLLHGVFY
jgi:hypothetical protein